MRKKKQKQTLLSNIAPNEQKVKAKKIAKRKTI